MQDDRREQRDISGDTRTHARAHKLNEVSRSGHHPLKAAKAMQSLHLDAFVQMMILDGWIWLRLCGLRSQSQLARIGAGASSRPRLSRSRTATAVYMGISLAPTVPVCRLYSRTVQYMLYRTR